MSAIVNGLVGGLIATALVLLAERKQKPARATAEGWKTLRAGWLLNATVVGCTGFAALMAYILLFVGSSRPDAERQMMYAFALVIGFGVAAIYMAWTSYGRTIMWKGDELRVRTILGHEGVHCISDICSINKSEMFGEYRLKFGNGATLRVSAYFNGAKELVAELTGRIEAVEDWKQRSPMG